MSSCPQISFVMPAFKPRFFKQANESIFPQTSTEVSTQNDRPGSTRIELFDIIKGIGMFLVVLGHIQCNYGHDPEWIRFLRNWLYQFHIPLFFFITGYCCKQLIIPLTAISSGMRIFIIVICTVILLITCTGNRFDIALHVFSNPVLATVCPWVGIVGIICLSSLLAELPARPGTLSYIGIHSMSVLIGQFAAFKAVTIIQIAVLPQFDTKCLTAHPCLLISGGWWIAYLLFGLCLPLLFEKYAVIHRQSK